MCIIFRYLLFFYFFCKIYCYSPFTKVSLIHNTKLFMNYNEAYNKKNFKYIIRRETYKNPQYDDILPILLNLENSFININKLLRCVSINDLEGINNKINIQNEEQKKLDLISNSIISNSLCVTGQIDQYISEEEEKICSCSNIISDSFDKKYYAVFDPLDGSSNIDSGLPTGSIFGIYKKNYNNDVLQKGSNIVMAGYCLYSASTQLLLSLNNENYLFMFDDKYNEFILIKKNIRIPNNGSIYSFNFGNMNEWELNIQNFIKDSFNESSKITNRYMGALVADTHNIIFNGGLFGYPSTLKNKNGKLRLMYEAVPIAYIIENLGGMATNGTHRILDIKPNNIHQRTQLFLGSNVPMLKLKEYF